MQLSFQQSVSPAVLKKWTLVVGAGSDLMFLLRFVINQSIHRLIDWLTDWLTDWLCSWPFTASLSLVTDAKYRIEPIGPTHRTLIQIFLTLESAQCPGQSSDALICANAGSDAVLRRTRYYYIIRPPVQSYTNLRKGLFIAPDSIRSDQMRADWPIESSHGILPRCRVESSRVGRYYHTYKHSCQQFLNTLGRPER